jgi:uncharacterized protein (TIGR02246 family)
MPTLTEDRDAIRDLYARYCLYFDSARGDDYASLFAEDGTFDTRMGDPVVGREALAAMVNGSLAHYTHHMITNQVIEVDSDRATCDASAMVFAKGVLKMTAHTHDDLQRIGGEWKITFRSYEPDPVDDASVSSSEADVALAAERMKDFQQRGGWATQDA